MSLEWVWEPLTVDAMAGDLVNDLPWTLLGGDSDLPNPRSCYYLTLS